MPTFSPTKDDADMRPATKMAQEALLDCAVLDVAAEAAAGECAIICEGLTGLWWLGAGMPGRARAVRRPGR